MLTNAVTKSSPKGLVGTGFASRYRFQPTAGLLLFVCFKDVVGRCETTTSSSLSLTSNSPANNWSVCVRVHDRCVLF